MVDLLKFVRRHTAAKAAPDMEELTRVTSIWQAETAKWSNAARDVDDALATYGYGLYTQQMMADDQVKACVRILKLGVIVGGWSISAGLEPGEDGYDQAKEIADFVEWNLSEMIGTVEKVVMSMTHALVAGFSISEKIWTILDKEPYAGMIGIKQLKSRPAESFTFDCDEFGNAKQVIQQIGGDRYEIPLDKLLLYTYDEQETGKPQGVSAFRAAYRAWFIKSKIERYMLVWAEKYAAPTPWGKYPKGSTTAQKDALLKACKSMVTDTAMITPDDQSIELLQSQGNGSSPYIDMIGDCNRAIAVALIGQTLTTDSGGGSGSYALGQVHQGTQRMYLDGLRAEVSQTFREQLIKPLVDYNFDTALYPELVLAPPDERDLTALSGIVKVLTEGEYLSAKFDSDTIREMFGLPPKTQEAIDQEIADEEAAAQAEKDRLAALQNAPKPELGPDGQPIPPGNPPGQPMPNLKATPLKPGAV